MKEKLTSESKPSPIANQAIAKSKQTKKPKLVYQKINYLESISNTWGQVFSFFFFFFFFLVAPTAYGISWSNPNRAPTYQTRSLTHYTWLGIKSTLCRDNAWSLTHCTTAGTPRQTFRIGPDTALGLRSEHSRANDFHQFLAHRGSCWSYFSLSIGFICPFSIQCFLLLLFVCTSKKRPQWEKLATTSLADHWPGLSPSEPKVN